MLFGAMSGQPGLKALCFNSLKVRCFQAFGLKHQPAPLACSCVAMSVRLLQSRNEKDEERRMFEEQLAAAGREKDDLLAQVNRPVHEATIRIHLVCLSVRRTLPPVRSRVNSPLQEQASILQPKHRIASALKRRKHQRNKAFEASMRCHWRPRPPWRRGLIGG